MVNISPGDALPPNFSVLSVADSPLHFSVASFLVLQLQTVWLNLC